MTPSLDIGCRVGGVIVWWYHSQGLGGSGIEYMIEKHVFTNVCGLMWMSLCFV